MKRKIEKEQFVISLKTEMETFANFDFHLDYLLKVLRKIVFSKSRMKEGDNFSPEISTTRYNLKI